MAWTKRQFIIEAFTEIGIAAYEFDLTPEQLQSALRRLDAMMAEWNGKGIRLAYPLPNTPDGSDLDQSTDVPDAANAPIYLNLAARLAPAYGKQLNPATIIAAKSGLQSLMNKAAMPGEMQMPSGFPAGAGNKPDSMEGEWLADPVDPLATGPDSALVFE